jgi:S1-C subfamily serine protease
MDQQFFIRTRGHVLGPYDLEKLQGLSRRGQLSRMHEVSTDGVTWVKASTFPELFQSPAVAGAAQAPAGAPAAFRLGGGEHGNRVGSEAQTGSGPAKWYYANGQGQQGPVDASHLQQLLASRQLSGDSRIWSEGMTDWAPINQVPELAHLAASSSAAGGGSFPIGDEAGQALVASKQWILTTIIIAFLFAALSGLGGAAYIIRGIQGQNTAILINGLIAALSAFLVAGGGILLCGYHRRIALYSHEPSGRAMSAALYAGRAFWRYVGCVAILGVGVVCVQVAFAVLSMAPLRGGGPGLGGEEIVSAGPAKAVNSLDNESGLSDAVGLVVVGNKWVWPDGTATEEWKGHGSGFMVSRQGFLITNRHVVADTAKDLNANLLREKYEKELLVKWKPTVWVFLEGRKYEAEIKHVSGECDFAVLKIAREGGHYFRLSSKEEMSRGLPVYALGFPGVAREAISEEETVEKIAKYLKQKDNKLPGHPKIEDYCTPRDFVFSETSGTVSRVIKEKEGRTWVQHNADINGGNSGGPLAEKNGLIVGINTLGIKADAGHGTFFSLSLPQIRQDLDKHIPDITWE